MSLLESNPASCIISSVHHLYIIQVQIQPLGKMEEVFFDSSTNIFFPLLYKGLMFLNLIVRLWILTTSKTLNTCHK